MTDGSYLCDAQTITGQQGANHAYDAQRRRTCTYDATECAYDGQFPHVFLDTRGRVEKRLGSR